MGLFTALVSEVSSPSTTSKLLSACTIDNALSFVTIPNAIRLFGLWVSYRLLLALYYVSPLHPLYEFPGPKLAAASYLYEAWYDAVLGGKYSWQIKAMHEKYGPIVRINPHELHCDDYDFVDEIYASGSRIRDKHTHFLKAFPGELGQSTFATRDHETHRMRRGAFNKFFSRQAMLRYEPEILVLVQKMCNKFLRLAESGDVIDASDAFNCFSVDAISQYCFGEPVGFLDRPDFQQNYKHASQVYISTFHFFRHIPVFRHLTSLMPFIRSYLGPNLAYMVKLVKEIIPSYVTKAQQQKSSDNPRIFTHIMNSPIPDNQKTMYRLSGEGIGLVLAGSDNNTGGLALIAYILLAQPEMLARLREELKNEDPHKLSWVQLEKYPYLYGVIYEALRVSFGVPGRLPRVARNEDLVYKGRGVHYVIPRGTAIGMSAFVCHANEDVFPESEKFVPERWIDAQGKPNHAMEKYLMSFSKGSRQCAAMNLALCELYLATAALALQVLPHLKLHDTVWEDVKFDVDAVVARPKSGTRGVRVIGIRSKSAA